MLLLLYWLNHKGRKENLITDIFCSWNKKVCAAMLIIWSYTVNTEKSFSETRVTISKGNQKAMEVEGMVSLVYGLWSWPKQPNQKIFRVVQLTPFPWLFLCWGPQTKKDPSPLRCWGECRGCSIQAFVGIVPLLGALQLQDSVKEMILCNPCYNCRHHVWRTTKYHG